MTRYIAEIETRVAGIPCLVGVLRFDPSDHGGWYVTDWQLLDRRGRPAAWLERKLNDSIRRDVDETICNYLQ